ncbi:hypothetical protein ANCCAN_09602, partial [Ancylostoma caninum]
TDIWYPSIVRSLDRFAFKNPKEGSTSKSTTNRALRKKLIDPWGVKKLSLPSKEYLSKKITELAADEHYLHRFASFKFSHQNDNEKKRRTIRKLKASIPLSSIPSLVLAVL